MLPIVIFTCEGSIDTGDERFAVEYYPDGLHELDTVVLSEIESGYCLWQVMVGRWMAENGISGPCEWEVFTAGGEHCLAEGRSN